MDTQNFLFLGRGRLVVQKDSNLSRLLKQLVSEGKTFEVTEITSKLLEAQEGNIHPDLLEKWPNILN
ncbi:MAG: hypothetical protein Q8934_19695 [Bacillota bacterium]|nr:hypothetical protein [Bacillota bacterium]